MKEQNTIAVTHKDDTGSAFEIVTYKKERQQVAHYTTIWHKLYMIANAYKFDIETYKGYKQAHKELNNK